MKSRSTVVALMIVALAYVPAGGAAQQTFTVSTAEVSPQWALLDQYCVTCHSQRIVSSQAVPDENRQITQLRNVGLTLDTEHGHRTAGHVWVREVKADQLTEGGADLGHVEGSLQFNAAQPAAVCSESSGDLHAKDGHGDAHDIHRQIFRSDLEVGGT